MRSILGLDIGGANLKAAHLSGVAKCIPFALWQAPAQLPDQLRSLSIALPRADLVALTMTGELCDCFSTKREGVYFILNAVKQAMPDLPIVVWGTDGRFADVAATLAQPLRAAAANWLALATFAGRMALGGAAVLVDIGSTTTDIVPLLDGKPTPTGFTDTDRLRSGELVYTGVQRTPLCALLGPAVMAELFATMRDAYLVLGDTPESTDIGTADGRPATRECAHARLARMLGGDAETCTQEETLALARQARAVQHAIVRHALRRVLRTLPAAPQTILVSGSGEFLAQAVLAQERVDEKCCQCLSQRLGADLSIAACAYAVAVLAGEQVHAVSSA